MKRATAVVVTAAVIITACGGGGGRPSSASATTTASGQGTPLNQAQAFELASMLYLDYQAAGSLIHVSIDYQAGTTVTITGAVDFVDHEGHLTVTTVVTGSGTSVENVDYTKTTVYEQGGPVVESELAQHGRPGQTWVSRPADPTDRPIDKVIEILVSLASPTRDNPLLIQQSQARYLGQTRLNGTPVDIFRYSQAITYYVAQASGVLAEFVGSVSGFAGPVTILFSAPGPESVGPPPAATVLSTTSG